MSFNLKKNFQNLGGTSVVTPELLRDDSTATDSLNIDIYDNYGISKRRGEELVDSLDGQGIVAATLSNGTKVIIRSGELNAITTITPYNLIIEHTGTEELRVVIGHEFVDATNDKYIAFLKDSVEVARYSLGGPNTLNTKTIDDLITEINVPNVSVQVDAPGAAFSAISYAYSLAISNKVIIEDLDDTITYEYLEEITGNGIPNIDKKPVDFIERDGILYFTSDNGLMKFDGTNYYRASLPKPTYSISPTPLPYVGPDPEAYVYRIVYTFTDAQGNVIESTPSDERTVVRDSAPSGTYEIIPNAAELSGFGPGTTYSVLRTLANGSVFFVVAEGLDPSVGYFDNTDDDNLNQDYTLPPFELNATTEGKYIDIWRNSLVMTGFVNDPDKVLYEDIQFTEGFSLSNSFLTQSRRGGENTGIFSQDNGLYVFKEDSITLVTGDLNTSQFQVDKISEEGIGAISNLSIIESLGRVWFMSKEGVYSVSLEGLKEESADLRPIFEKEYRTSQLRDTFGFNNTLDSRLMFTIPSFDINGFLLEVPKTYVYNLELQKWFIWDTIDFSRGMSINDEEIWYLGSSNSSDFDNAFYSRTPRTFTDVDFSDRGLPIACEYRSQWETLGEPSVPKKFVRMKIYSIDNHRQKFETFDFTLDIETEHNYVYGTTESRNSLRFYELNDGVTRTPVKTRRTRLKPKKARSLRYILKNSELNKNILVSGVEFEVAVEHAGYMRSE